MSPRARSKTDPRKNPGSPTSEPPQAKRGVWRFFLAGFGLALVLLVWALGAGRVFGNGTEAPEVEWLSLQAGSLTFRVEVARTPEAWRQGLMRRKSLPADGGMLFVYGDDQIRRFWMRNTLIPLDIAYLDYRKTVLEIHGLSPESEAVVESRWPARYALELPSGSFTRAGVAPGDRLVWE